MAPGGGVTAPAELAVSFGRAFTAFVARGVGLGDAVTVGVLTATAEALSVGGVAVPWLLPRAMMTSRTTAPAVMSAA